MTPHRFVACISIAVALADPVAAQGLDRQSLGRQSLERSDRMSAPRERSSEGFSVGGRAEHNRGPERLSRGDDDERPRTVPLPRQIPGQPAPVRRERAMGDERQRDFFGRPMVTCQTAQGYCRFVYRQQVEPGLPCRCGETDGLTR